MKSEYLKIELWFIDQDFKQLEIKDQINITLDINESVKYKKKYLAYFKLGVEDL